MAVIHFTNYKKQSAAGLRAVLNYTEQDRKTVHDGKKYVSGINCMPKTAYTEFQNTKRLYGKTEGRQFYHFVQSFPAGMKISPNTAHEIALRLASESKKLKGYEIVISTHSDREHIHSHFVINSVNAETGKKFHISEPEIEEIMCQSDRLCHEYGLKTLDPVPKRQRIKPMSDREYRSADKNESWKLRLAIDIDNAMKLALSREHFISLMESEGYKVRWTDERRYITYTTPGGFQCRDNKLHEEKYTKGMMENEFRIRKEILGAVENTGASADSAGGEGGTLRRGHRAKLESNARFPKFADRAFNENSVGAGFTDYGTAFGGLYESSTSNSDRVRSKGAKGSRGLSVRGRQADAEYGERFESMDFGGGETGWEFEREAFANALGGGSGDEEIYVETMSHQPDSDSDPYSMGIGAVYLAADLMGIVKNEHPVQDSTTMKPRRERRKQDRGPTMSGM